MSDRPPLPQTHQQRPRPSAARTAVTSGSPAQTGACARRSSPAKTPGRRITLGPALRRQHGGRGAPLPGKAGLASHRGAELTRSTCLEPAGRQQQAAAAAQRHGEPVPATASGGSHLPSAQGHLGAAILVRAAPSPGSRRREDYFLPPLVMSRGSVGFLSLLAA